MVGILILHIVSGSWSGWLPDRDPFFLISRTISKLPNDKSFALPLPHRRVEGYPRRILRGKTGKFTPPGPATGQGGGGQNQFGKLA